MNLFISFCKIIMTPRLYRHNNKPLVKLYMSTLNPKKGFIAYLINGKLKGKFGMKIFDLYKTGDFVLIEGSINIKSKKKKMRKKKIITINIKKIRPAQIVFK
uniref:Single-stranded DNA binding protein n=1 Tax=Leiomenia cribrosa TaxID=217483 RepID=A0A4D6WWC9_9FLOR|nr:hypothetical protein [Leiomenia cribrosa]